ncbi:MULTISPECIES: ABC transporter ATP-binding protein [Halolamina]|uniref:ABC-2 type transport system ATP-binding protein n=1 Tax=Halolamina pelagica TaxID=699431 RepID=A0A1I5TR49_9EURY|nr:MULTISPECIES: ABC transporter ATP-binding protein [Halolamina]NHX37774.1 ABC transporter ATP-binding protein [Halolamina sp. R1-12]SFP85515.1 ABC-2 type transport system ATP-binding protein [Halolamina pelagica]
MDTGSLSDARGSAGDEPVAIQTRGLTKRYGEDVLAVDDLDLTVYEGEIFGFLGPNGAGKSTTIDVIMDYVRPSAGSATVLGFDAQRETRAIHERVGILPDGYGLYDRLSGRKHLEYAISLKRATDDVDDLLDRVGLDASAADRVVGGYSKGMTQRLALAIALVGDPELLILDEPSSGLDPNGVRLVREIARDHADRGRTVFFSSHILSQVEAVCDRVAILNRGRLVAVDSIAGLRDALGTGSTVTLTVDSVPDSLTVAAIAGVSDVAVDDRTIRVRVDEATAKVDVIDRVRDDGAAVLDVTIEESSLEDLFSAYTGDAPRQVGAPEGER